MRRKGLALHVQCTVLFGLVVDLALRRVYRSALTAFDYDLCCNLIQIERDKSVRLPSFVDVGCNSVLIPTPRVHIYAWSRVRFWNTFGSLTFGNDEELLRNGRREQATIIA